MTAEGEPRYLVLVHERGSSRPALRDSTRAQAWQLALELRAAGERVSISVVVNGTPRCVVDMDDPLGESADELP